MTEREKFIVLLDCDSPQKSDAIILLEGDGFARYEKAVYLYKEGVAPIICFSGGFDDEESGAYTFDKIKPLILNCGIPETCLMHENASKNTYDQAVEIVKIAKEKNWKRISLVASHYHSYRAFLTFLRVIKKEKPSLLMDMAAVKNLDWFKENTWGKRIDLLKNEFDKIELYQKKDNVAKFTEGVEYLEWKNQQQKKY